MAAFFSNLAFYIADIGTDTKVPCSCWGRFMDIALFVSNLLLYIADIGTDIYFIYIQSYWAADLLERRPQDSFTIAYIFVITSGTAICLNVLAQTVIGLLQSKREYGTYWAWYSLTSPLLLNLNLNSNFLT